MLLLSVVTFIRHRLPVTHIVKINRPLKMLLKPKVVGRSRAYDILHRVGVNSCIMGTLFAVGTLAYISFPFDKEFYETKKSVNVEADIDVAASVNEKEGKSL